MTLRCEDLSAVEASQERDQMVNKLNYSSILRDTLDENIVKRGQTETKFGKSSAVSKE